MKREQLPKDYENRYKSESLKEKIVDDGMWLMIPAVTGDMNSVSGIRRLKENDSLFRFIDEYFPDSPFAFEPNMQDGRFVFVPDKVSHQGIGICASSSFPGFLEIAHFWYPCEFTGKTISFGPGQVYVPIYSYRPGMELAEVVRRVYMVDEEQIHHGYCTFPFDMDIVLTLEENFLDSLNQTSKMIRDSLKGSSQQARRNGEGLIQFMERIMNE